MTAGAPGNLENILSLFLSTSHFLNLSLTHTHTLARALSPSRKTTHTESYAYEGGTPHLLLTKLSKHDTKLNYLRHMGEAEIKAAAPAKNNAQSAFFHPSSCLSLFPLFLKDNTATAFCPSIGLAHFPSFLVRFPLFLVV